MLLAITAVVVVGSLLGVGVVLFLRAVRIIITNRYKY